MTSALDDEDLSLSIPQPRRNSKDEARRDFARDAPSTSSTSTKTSAHRKDINRLGQYNIVKTLGEGSFGKVKLAIHSVSGQKVALKIISRRKLVTRDMAGRIEREISYLQLLRHPHIIKLYTVITLPNEIIMVLEYAGGELFDYIVQNGKMAEDKARKFFQQIICAVEYCHRHKIVHRDLKPENLLLDENLNVKIADFGLSNIMTDGNFLKTSCGSPNYAAPEVISGKLYAGPEVDVWSCGVILYVLLVGRLPFDDEYIPALFKKIAQGNYMVPHYISKGASQLIKRMLQVNPVNRITVPEIRQDPWFKTDLADYLKPPVEEFLDTGIDPNQAIDPFELNKGKPKPLQEKLHRQVVDKLTVTLGFGANEVQEQLSQTGASAIKDAYLIVRENAMMRNTAAMEKDQPGFFATSPPQMGHHAPASPMSPARPPMSPLGNVEHPRHGSTGSASLMEARSPLSGVSVLPTSMPEYHAAFMRGQVDKTSSPQALEDTPADRPRTKEEQDATARRLKPHNKSSSNLHRQHGHADKPEPMTTIPDRHVKKQKQTKWQFGIRSRNTPAEAMLAIYKALRKMGAVWEVPKRREPGATGSGEASPERRPRREGEESPEYSDSDPEADTDPEYATHEEQERRRRRRAEQNEQGRRGRERYGRWNDYGYSLPEDPWVIQARFKKDGMFPPGVAHPSSTHSSRVDLTNPDSARRQRSATGSSQGQSRPDSAAGSSENGAVTGPPPVTAPTPLSTTSSAVNTTSPDWPVPNEIVWVYVTIQLYSIEKDFYLVDFKCAGYERLVRRFARKVSSEMNGSQELDANRQGAENGEAVVDEEEEVVEGEDGEQLVGAGRVAEEKEISSPFPFLDVAGRLIIQLAAEAD